jgi:hypothetical protein
MREASGFSEEVMGFRVSFTVLLVAMLLARTSTGSAAEGCQGKGPEVVLDCFSAAYSERSAEKLERVMAPDYIWVAVSPPEVDVFTRAESMAASLRMFADEAVELVSLEFEDGYGLVEGADPGTWRIEDLRALMTVKATGVAETATSLLCVTLYVRKSSTEPDTYQVYREVFFEHEGCVGK